MAVAVDGGDPSATTVPLGGTVETVITSPRIAPAPATLEEARHAPGRAEKIEEITRRIEAQGIKYVFFQQVSVTGRVMGKGVVSTFFPQVAEKGYQLVYGATANLFTDRAGNYIGFGPEESELPEGLTKPYCYHIHQFEELRPVLLDVVDWGQQLGLDMSYGDHEDAPGQLELNFRFDRPLRTADNLTTYRQVCAAVGRKHGVLPSWMPKPFTGVSANGHHHHFTLVDEEGNNVFHDPDGPAQLSELARHFLGRMFEHFGALMCVGNPTVNSYCRMWDTGFWAPIYKNWGWQNRTTTVRVATGGRVEEPGGGPPWHPDPTNAGPLHARVDGRR